MRIRELALALPLVMGIAACKTSSTQGSTTASAGQPATAAPGSVTAAHSDDEVVTGKISRLTPQSVTIATTDGTDKTLQLVPETSIKLDGHDTDKTALEEGLPVRASFSNVQDREVAVEVHAVTTATADQGPAIDPGAGGTGGQGGSQGSGDEPNRAGKPPTRH